LYNLVGRLYQKENLKRMILEKNKYPVTSSGTVFIIESC